MIQIKFRMDPNHYFFSMASTVATVPSDTVATMPKVFFFFFLLNIYVSLYIYCYTETTNFTIFLQLLTCQFLTS